jgi:hypothetical protein
MAVDESIVKVDPATSGSGVGVSGILFRKRTAIAPFHPLAKWRRN